VRRRRRRDRSADQPEVAEEGRRRARRVVVAGLSGGDVAVSRWSLGADGRGHMTMDGTDMTIPLRGAHNLRNATLALAVAREVGISMEDAARGIARMDAPPMRSSWEQIAGVTLINDAYNSNPGSARAAIDMLAHAGSDDAAGGHARQRVAVLGSMLELGPTAPTLHDEIARAALTAPVDLIAGVGDFADALRRVGAPSDRVVSAATADDLWPSLMSRLRPNAIILLKGSRGVRLERLVPFITSWAQTATT
jgi:UDP-N-acetylmuramoyl-tripeptide--D-alanyl-D-alanine ligase